MVLNAHHDVVAFALSDVKGGRDWERLADTNLPDEDDEPEDRERFKFGHLYQVTGRSLVLFRLRPERLPRM